MYSQFERLGGWGTSIIFLWTSEREDEPNFWSTSAPSKKKLWSYLPAKNASLVFHCSPNSGSLISWAVACGPLCFSGIFVGHSFVATLRSHCPAAAALVMSWALDHHSLCVLLLLHLSWSVLYFSHGLAFIFVASGVAHSALRALDTGFLFFFFFLLSLVFLCEFWALSSPYIVWVLPVPL